MLVASVDSDRCVARMPWFALGRRTGIDYSDATPDVAYAHDAAGHVTSSYAWDALSRVDAVTGEGAGDAAFDAAGSVTRLPDGRALTYDDGRQLTSMATPGVSASPDVTTAFTYDARGNRLTAATDAGAAAGTVTNTFDLANRLTSVAGIDGSASTYAYDGSGLRASTSAGGATESFVWDVSAAYPLLLTDADHAYVYGVAGVPLEQVALGGGAVDYLHSDALGSVVATTDGSGDVTSRSDYDLYGVPTAVGSGPATPSVTRFGYAGEYTDPTGYIYLRARYYDPATAQFLSVDPLVDTTGNPYGYTNGNPLQGVDPLGLVDGWQIGGDAAAGFADRITFGATRWVREQLGVNDAVNTCSGAYMAGGYVGTAVQVGLSFASGGLSLAYDAIGAVVSAGDAYGAFERGDFGGALIAAAGALPGVPGGFRGASDAASAAARGERAANTAARSSSVVDDVLAETAGATQRNLTSSYTLSADEALTAGQRWVGEGYVELGKPGSGVFRSADGLQQFRMDGNSLMGNHAPGVPHVHLETYAPGARVPSVNNHIPFRE